MEKQPQYTFQDWIDGKCSAQKEHFSETDWLEIQNKQKELYNEAIEKMFTKLMADFYQRQSTSLDSSILLKTEYNLYFDLFNKDLKDSTGFTLYETPYWTPIKDGGNIRRYYDLRMVGGVIDYQLIEYSEMDKNILIHPEILYMIKADSYYKYLLYLDNLMKEYDIENEHKLNKQSDSIQKIKWLASPALFGYIFLELINKKFIEPPFHGGEHNYAGFAKLCYQYFDINTSQENLIKEMNPKKSTLSDTKKAKFTIPQLSDLQ